MKRSHPDRILTALLVVFVLSACASAYAGQTLTPGFPGLVRAVTAQFLPPVPAGEPGTPPSAYVTGRFFYRGKVVYKVVVPGRPPLTYRARMAAVPLPRHAAGVNILANVPSFDWNYGCSPTSAGMIFGYYDRTGYPNMYTGPTNGGVCPLDNSSWGTTAWPSITCAECPFVASHEGLEGRATRGHVDDYWIDYDGTASDPYITGSWTQHAADCTADFMGTNQSALGNADGSTTFYYYGDGTPLVDYDPGPGAADGCHGMNLFAQSRGYSVVTNYTEVIAGTGGSGTSQGFTFANYESEIDAGRPVLIQVSGHTMVGYGYDSSTQTVYLHNTWGYGASGCDTMTWGGKYSGMQQYGVTVLQLVPTAPPPIVMSTTPATGAMGVAVSSAITVTFSQAMNESATGAAFSLAVPPSGPNLPGSFRWSADGTTLTFTPTSALAYSTPYAAYFTTGAQSAAGVALAAAYGWNFTTAPPPPTVVSTTPAAGAKGVAVTSPLTATFSAPMNESATQGAFSLTSAAGSVAGSFSWSADGTTLTFTPSANLTPSLIYTAGFTVAAPSAAAVPLAAPYSWQFTTAGAVPTVVATDPLSNGTGASLVVNPPVSVTFSEAMNEYVTQAAFSLTSSAGKVPGSFSWSTDGTTLLFTPSANLAPMTVYTAALTTAAQSVAGVALAVPYSWQFTSAGCVPTVDKITPTNNATGVPVTVQVSVIFSHTMNESATQRAFSLTSSAGKVSGVASWSADGRVLTFTPSAHLRPAQAYTLALTTAAQSKLGVPLAAVYSSLFTTAGAVPTVVETSPANNAVSVSVQAPVSVAFSHAMNESVTQGAFSLTSNSGQASGSFYWSADGRTLFFTPDAPLSPSTAYTIRVTTAAHSAAGLALAAPCCSNFTTVTPPPNVLRLTLGFSPPPGGSTVAVAFSEAMEQTSTQGAFSLTTNTGSVVSGSFSWSSDSKTMTFTPSAPLASSTRYTVTITTAARSAAGVRLASRYSLAFSPGAQATTAAAPPAAVTAAVAEPVAGGAALTYVLSAPANVEVTVLNLAGRVIADLPAGPQAAGLQTLRWNGRNQTGSLAPGGVYLVRITARAADGTSAQAVAVMNLGR